MGTTTLTSGTTDTGYVLENLLSGSRSDLWRTTTSQTAVIHTDMGSGSTATPYYYYLARADLYYNAVKASTSGKTILESSSNDSSWSNQLTETWYSLFGPRGEDYINVFGAGVSATRYWRVTLTTGDGATTSKHTLSKLMFGSYFDLGRDPEYGVMKRRAFKQPGARDQAFILNAQWRGITDAKRMELNDSILAYRDVSPIVLYETTDNLLQGFKLLHAWIVDCKVTPISLNSNEISMTFEECI